MEEQTNGHRLPRLSVTKGYEIWCDQCGAVAFVATQVEAVHEKSEHVKKHKAEA